MDGNGELLLLYTHAAEYRFDAFHALFSEAEEAGRLRALPEAYLLRAQIKLFSGDRSLLEDMDRAEEGALLLRFPCLGRSFRAESPNRFVAFREKPGELKGFLEALPEAGERLRKHYGEEGYSMARQMRSELLYFTGRLEEAADLARQQWTFFRGEHGGAVMAGYVLFRCYLGLSRPEAAEQCLLEVIRAVKDAPETHTMYKVIRDWANLTTGWSGDTPRYHRTPDGHTLPVLEDRTAAIQGGIASLSPSEAPFAEYLALCHADAYTMRELYMEIFRAMYAFRGGDFEGAEGHFEGAYRAALSGGLLMPFVEYGRQIVPLLRHMLQKRQGDAANWIGGTILLCEQYERSLEEYRTALPPG